MKNNEDPSYLVDREKFDIYYKTSILEALNSLEKTRRKYFNIFMIISVFVLVWIFFCFANILAIFSESNQGNDILSIITCVLIILLFWPIFSYRKKSKNTLLPLITNFFGDFRYDYNQPISENILADSLLIKKYDSISSEDNFIGFYEDVKISISEYSLYNIYTKTRNNRQTVERKKIFQGICFYTSMNKKFKGQTIVVRDNGIFNRFVKYSNMSRVSLESPEFEKKFEVYSTDQIEARYILTTALINQITSLSSKFNKIELSFFQNHLLINIKTKKNMFECTSFFRSLINEKRIYKSFDELYDLFQIVHILKLNKDILL